MIYAPVEITTLCRYEHLKKLITSLQNNTHAEKTDVYIAVDYPSKPEHREGYERICEYLDSGIKGFKSLNVIKREYNYGPSKNSIELSNMILEKYDRFIFTEDDNEFAPNFLDFMNKCLEKYYYDEKVMQVCGFSYPIHPDREMGNTLELSFVNAWGVGRWKHKHQKYTSTGLEYYEKKMRNFFASVRCMENNYPAYLYVKNKIFSGQKIMYGDYKMSIYNAINKYVAIAPRDMLVRNNGFDGSGEHCSSAQDKVLNSRELSNDRTFNFIGKTTKFTKRDKKKINLLFITGNVNFWHEYYIALLYSVFGKENFCRLLSAKKKIDAFVKQKFGGK